MNYSKKERLRRYKKVLKWYRKNGWVKSFKHCYCLCHAFIVNGVIDENYGIDDYPEIIKHRPINYFIYWFDLDRKGYQKRIAILRNAIKELKNGVIVKCIGKK